MGLLSEDDELMQRGANPRTGVVSPYVLSDAIGDSLKGNYIAMEKEKAKRESERGRARSGRWKQDSLGWSLIDESLLNPVAQTLTKSLSQESPVNGWQDSVAVEKSFSYNREEERVVRERPDAVQTSVQWGSDWLSIPSKGPNKIHRKDVGSGRSQRKGSDEIMAAKRQAKHPSKLGVMKSRTLMSSSPQNRSFHSSESSQHSNKSCEAPKPRLSPSRLVANQTTYYPPNLAAQNSCAPQTITQQSSLKTLSPPLPYLHFLHPNNPSDFTYPTVSYRRPQQLLPARLKLSGTGTTTDTSYTVADPSYRPQVRRKNGATTVPKLLVNSIDQKRELCEQCWQPVIGREIDTPKPILKMGIPKPNIDKIEINTGTLVSDTEGTTFRDQKKAQTKEGTKLKVKTRKLPVYTCQGCSDPIQENSSNVTLNNVQLCHKGNDVVPNPSRDFHQGGSKLIHIDGTLDSSKNFETLGVNMRAMSQDLRRRTHIIQHQQQQQQQQQQPHIATNPCFPRPSIKCTNCGESPFTSQCPKGLEGCDAYGDCAAEAEVHQQQQRESQIRRKNTEQYMDTLIKSLVGEVREWVIMMSRNFHAGAKICYIYHQVSRIIGQFLLTLYYSSPTLEDVFRMMPCTVEEIGIEVYKVVIYKLLVPCVFLVVLLNVSILIYRVVKFLVQIIGLTWILLRMSIVIVRWCTLG